MADSPPPIAQHITFLYTDDLEASARFYEGALGLELALDQGTCKIWRVCPGSFLGMCTRQEAARPDGVIFTLVTPEVDAWAARLRARGVEIEEGPAYNPDYDIYHLFVRDPGGYLVEIQRFEGQAPA